LERLALLAVLGKQPSLGVITASSFADTFAPFLLSSSL